MKIIISLILISSFTAGILYHTYKNNQPPLIATSIYQKTKKLPQFELTDMNNNPFSNQQLMEKWSVIFFGYTFCPDICPTTMSALAQVANKLSPEVKNHVQFIFVSVDPQRDTPAHLAEYIPFYHPDFIAISGNDEQLQTFSMSLGAMYMKVANNDSYVMDHSSTVFIVNPQGERYGIFNRSSTGVIDTNAIAQDLNILLAN